MKRLLTILALVASFAGLTASAQQKNEPRVMTREEAIKLLTPMGPAKFKEYEGTLIELVLLGETGKITELKDWKLDGDKITATIAGLISPIHVTLTLLPELKDGERVAKSISLDWTIITNDGNPVQFVADDNLDGQVDWAKIAPSIDALSTKAAETIFSPKDHGKPHEMHWQKELEAVTTRCLISLEKQLVQK